MVAVGVLAAAGTYAGTTLTEPPARAVPTPAHTCPANVKPDGCAYLTQLNTAFPGMVPTNAYQAAEIICINLRTITPEEESVAWQSNHTTFNLSQAEKYISITQDDVPSSCYW